METKNIQENTIDFSAHIYDSPHFDQWRYSVKTSPDFPGVVILAYEEFDEKTNSYLGKGEVSFDVDNWNKITYVVETLFKKNV